MKYLDAKINIQKTLMLWEQTYRDRWRYNNGTGQKMGPHRFDAMNVTVVVHISKETLGCWWSWADECAPLLMLKAYVIGLCKFLVSAFAPMANWNVSLIIDFYIVYAFTSIWTPKPSLFFWQERSCVLWTLPFCGHETSCYRARCLI